ncbi:hypothetical protein D9M70_498380 [compost metagenome]
MLRLVQIVDTRATGYGLAKWWRSTHGNHEEQPAQKWAAYLRGSLPQHNLRGLLIAEYPGLKEALVDPLWWSLSKLSTDSADRAFWDSCAGAIELNGAPLPACSHMVMSRLCATPSWTHLGLMLILLRSGSAKFAGYRTWLQRHFFSYFCIALLHDPIDRVAFRLFHCIDALVKDGSLAEGDGMDWPKDQQEFGAMFDGYQAAFELTHYRAWRNHWHETDDVHPLLWLLCKDAELCDEYCAMQTEAEFHDEYGERSPLSNRLRMRWRRTAERARKTQVSLAWSRCDQHGLPLSDRRVLHRLRLEAKWIVGPFAPLGKS